VTTLVAWTAKRSVIARIQSWSASTTGALAGVEVDYALPPEPDRICVYGGRVRSTRVQVTAENALVFREDIIIDIRVRVQVLGGDIEDAERTAESISQAVAVAVSAEPRITTGTIGVTATDQDPTIVAPDPDPYVTVNVLLSVTMSMLTQGS
jgi:hypothetical protein